MTLAEKLLLLSWDAGSGRPAKGITRAQLRRGLAAAVLAELVLHRRIVGDARALRVADSLPDYAALLSEGADVLRRAGRALSARAAVRRLEAGLPGLQARVIESLVGRDILHSEGGLLGRRNPVRSMQALREAQAELAACWNAAQPPVPALALAAIAHSAGLLRAHSTPADQYALEIKLRAARDASTGTAESTDTTLLWAIAEATAD